MVLRPSGQHGEDCRPPPFRMPKLYGINLHEITIQQLQHHFSNGHFTSAEYTAYCLERIRKTDQYLESVLEVNPDALSIATALDNEREDGKPRGPLHGIPVLVKDNMATADKMETTAGSWALLGSKVPRDACVVRKLREAGAVIIGHSTMSEWAGGRSSNCSSSYSPRGGKQARNPHDLSQSPFGSSGGSGATVSANIVPLALGTETDCSIIGPSIINGVVGIKPTVGLTSRAGVVPITENQDTVGPHGRTVMDAAIGLTVIAGKDPRDRFTLATPDNILGRDYTKYITTRHALKGARFGLPIHRVWDLVRNDHKRLASRLFEAIRAAGAEIIPVDFPCANDRIREDGIWDWEHGPPDQREFTVVKADAYNNLKSYFSELSNTNIKSVEDIIAFNVANRHTEGAEPGDHPAFKSGQDYFHAIAACKGIKDDDYYSSLAHCHKMCRDLGIDAALSHVLPSGEMMALDALLLCDHNGTGQQLAAQAGYPILALPIGLDDDGLPVGLTLQQTAWRDDALVKWGSAIEDLRNHTAGFGPRVAPAYKNHLAKNLPMGDIAPPHEGE